MQFFLFEPYFLLVAPEYKTNPMSSFSYCLFSVFVMFVIWPNMADGMRRGHMQFYNGKAWIGISGLSNNNAFSRSVEIKLFDPFLTYVYMRVLDFMGILPLIDCS